jgi:glycosyltransferase involved in cell wall biosynthesis
MPTSYCFLSTYAPTQCGLATFSAALMRAIAPVGSGDRASVVAVTETSSPNHRPEVVGHLRNGSPESVLDAAAELNRHDVAVIQHEYGIYGGTDGDEVLAVLDHVTVPVVVVLHTVLSRPTPHQRAVLDRVTAAADSVVTMTWTARQRLVDGYDVDAAKIVVIPHGAPEHSEHWNSSLVHHPTILTWGLLGPGKGIEWGLTGLREIRHLRPAPRYVIAGQTHPRVRRESGEAYRLGLVSRARALGVSNLVRFERGYLDEAVLQRLINVADVVLLPYDSYEQVTSGVLIEAIAAHKPIVSTAFPHAVELLSDGAGLLVPHGDGQAIGAALRRVLTEPKLSARMSAETARLAPGLRWPVVGERYRSLVDGLLGIRGVVIG